MQAVKKIIETGVAKYFEGARNDIYNHLGIWIENILVLRKKEEDKPTYDEPTIEEPTPDEPYGPEEPEPYPEPKSRPDKPGPTYTIPKQILKPQILSPKPSLAEDTKTSQEDNTWIWFIVGGLFLLFLMEKEVI